jgi:hypothetical protein
MSETDGGVLGSWITEVCAALELSPTELDRQVVLDLARDVAHGVARPAAPLTTFLVGLAAGRRGGSPEAVREVAGIVDRLVADRSVDPPA